MSRTPLYFPAYVVCSRSAILSLYRFSHFIFSHFFTLDDDQQSAGIF